MKINQWFSTKLNLVIIFDNLALSRDSYEFLAIIQKISLSFDTSSNTLKGITIEFSLQDDGVVDVHLFIDYCENF